MRRAIAISQTKEKLPVKKKIAEKQYFFKSWLGSKLSQGSDSMGSLTHPFSKLKYYFISSMALLAG